MITPYVSISVGFILKGSMTEGNVSLLRGGLVDQLSGKCEPIREYDRSSINKCPLHSSPVLSGHLAIEKYTMEWKLWDRSLLG
jgi:hypothetical protein